VSFQVSDFVKSLEISDCYDPGFATTGYTGLAVGTARYAATVDLPIRLGGAQHFPTASIMGRKGPVSGNNHLSAVKGKIDALRASQ
jgi:hypothetical protein